MLGKRLQFLLLFAKSSICNFSYSTFVVYGIYSCRPNNIILSAVWFHMNLMRACICITPMYFASQV